MRRADVLSPELRTLLHPKAVLLIYDYHAEIFELDIAFDECMCADDNMDIPFFEIVKNVFPCFALDTACEEHYFQSHAFEECTYTLEMLLCKDLRRCHETCLKSIVDRHQHSEQSDHGFAATDIALQKSVHLFAR